MTRDLDPRPAPVAVTGSNSAERGDPPPVTALCIVRVVRPATGHPVVTVSTSPDIATTEPVIVGNRAYALEALPLVVEFLRGCDDRR